ncbi:hypothetical protein WG66_010576 [Moniliophthora roreri]|nr:hypothetical protein WG66_010576 [Moniliophthora roreri]
MRLWPIQLRWIFVHNDLLAESSRMICIRVRSSLTHDAV